MHKGFLYTNFMMMGIVKVKGVIGRQLLEKKPLWAKLLAQVNPETDIRLTVG